MPKDQGSGAGSTRREGVRFLSGEGKYTDDINLQGQAHVHFLRSGVGHGLPMQEPAHPVLARGKLRHVGDPICVVSAETREQARDAAEFVVVDIEELPAVLDMKAAVAEGAARVTTLDLVNSRLVANPMIVEGQVHGGLALLEGCAYDDQGRLLSASYMDHTMPRADDLPNFRVDHSCVTLRTHNSLGVKGCGEAGAIGLPLAVVNAGVDAPCSAGHGVTHFDMPLSPSKVWAAMQG